MTKQITTDMQTHIGQTVTTLAACWRLTRTDGETFAFTGHDRDLEIDGVTYVSSSAFDRSAVESDPTMSVDNLEIQGIFDSEALRADELRAGLFDRAEITLFLVNWADLSMGKINLRRGWLGEVTLTPSGIFKSEIRGIIQALQQNIGEIYTTQCRADLGDSRCRVPVHPPLVGRLQSVAALNYYRKKDEAMTDDGSSALFHDVIFQCLVSGTTAEDDVTYDYSEGAETVDGDATFLAVTAWSRYGVVSGNTLFQTDTAVGLAGDFTIMNGGDELLPNGFILSPNGRFRLQLQGDSNLVLTDLGDPTSDPDVAIWSTGTAGASPSAARFVMQTDGNAVLYDTSDAAIWASNTGGSPGAYLALQDDGNLVIYAQEENQIFYVTWPFGVDPRIAAGTGHGVAASPDTWFVDGILTWETGLNAGLSMEVQYWDHSTSKVSLHLPMGFPISEGDKFRVYPGCSKFIGVKPAAMQATSVYGTFSGTTLTVVDPDGCFPKFQNHLNYRGEPFIPGVDFLVGQAGLNKPGFSTSGSKK